MRDSAPLAYLREAAAAARSQLAASLLVIAVLAGLVLAVSLTTGRAAAAQRQVLQVIDQEDTRSIVVRATADAGLSSDLVPTLGTLSGVSWVLGIGPAEDGRNTNTPDTSQAVGVRRLYATTMDPLHLTLHSPLPDAAYADPRAVTLLGFTDTVGTVGLIDGTTVQVVGPATFPPALTHDEPIVVIPSTPTRAQPLVAVAIQVAHPDQVAPVMKAVTAMVQVEDSSKLTFESSAKLAALRASVDANLASYGRGLLLLILGAGAALIGVILIAVVQLRRRDFGRRRALGATRTTIVTLLLLQITMLVLIGQGLGTAATLIAFRLRGDPIPGWDFFLALSQLTLAAALIGAILPAILASRRDPLTELRTP